VGGAESASSVKARGPIPHRERIVNQGKRKGGQRRSVTSYRGERLLGQKANWEGAPHAACRSKKKAPTTKKQRKKKPPQEGYPCKLGPAGPCESSETSPAKRRKRRGCRLAREVKGRVKLQRTPVKLNSTQLDRAHQPHQSESPCLRFHGERAKRPGKESRGRFNCARQEA